MQGKLPKFVSSIFGNLFKLAILLVVGYIIFSIGNSIWRNWQLTQKIKTTEELISQLQEENSNLKNQILYYQTATFKELEARRRLDMKKPGENMVILPENADLATGSANPTQKIGSTPEVQNIANPLKWWRFITR